MKMSLNSKKTEGQPMLNNATANLNKITELLYSSTVVEVPNYFIVINVTFTSWGHSSSFNKEFEVFATSKKDAYEIGKKFCNSYNVSDIDPKANAKISASVVLVDDI